MYRGLGQGSSVSYTDFAARYINKINPATGMYYTIADAARAAGIDTNLAESYVFQAQAAHAQDILPSYEPPEITQQPFYRSLVEKGIDPVTGESLPAPSVTPAAPAPSTTVPSGGPYGAAQPGETGEAVKKTSLPLVPILLGLVALAILRK